MAGDGESQSDVERDTGDTSGDGESQSDVERETLVTRVVMESHSLM